MESLCDECSHVFYPDSTSVMSSMHCFGCVHDSEFLAIGNPSICTNINMLHRQFVPKCILNSAFSTAGRAIIHRA